MWRLSRLSLEWKMYRVGGRPFGVVMREDFLMELFSLVVLVLGKVTGSKKDEVVVVEVIVWVA